MPEVTWGKIQRESITEKAVTLLRNRILAGDLPPGTRLIESQLAEELGVSRAPVREAFLILEPEGLVVSVSGKGTIVAETSAADLREIFTLRSVLEGMAVQLAVSRISADELARLNEIVEQMKGAVNRDDVESLIDLDLEFHESIWLLSGHKRLCDTLRNMLGPIRLFLAVNTKVYENLVDNVMEHVDLLEALRSGDAQVAKDMMTKHIEEAGIKNIEYLETIQSSRR